jgi:hypothetical protein
MVVTDDHPVFIFAGFAQENPERDVLEVEFFFPVFYGSFLQQGFGFIDVFLVEIVIFGLEFIFF